MTILPEQPGANTVNSRRQAQRVADLQALRALRADSTVFDFGEAPDQYTLIFRGAGLYREPVSGLVIPVDQHRCLLHLPFSYPQRPPEIRWLTPLLHPNVSFGGFIRLQDVGLDENAGMDAICERLWDVARLAYYDLHQATNRAARRWVESQQDCTLPIDPRPLRDRALRSNANVIRYRRGEGGGVVLLQGANEQEILYIGDDAPADHSSANREPKPSLADIAFEPQPRGPAAPNTGDTKEIFYIGD